MYLFMKRPQIRSSYCQDLRRPAICRKKALGFVVDRLEGAGFEVKAVDTIGVHYSATLWRWYRLVRKKIDIRKTEDSVRIS
jgi:nucleoside diphosphate kinase